MYNGGGRESAHKGRGEGERERERRESERGGVGR